MKDTIISCPVCGEEYAHSKYKYAKDFDDLQNELDIMDKNFVEKSEKLAQCEIELEDLRENRIVDNDIKEAYRDYIEELEEKINFLMSLK